MTTTRDLLATVLDGGTPERTPYLVHSWFYMAGGYPSFEEWKPLFDQGLGIFHSCPTVKRIEHDVENTSKKWVEGGAEYVLRSKKTEVGTVQSVKAYALETGSNAMGWTVEEWIKGPGDYETLQWICEHTELVPQYENFAADEEKIGDYGVTVASGSRTPAMSICVDLAGTELFCMDVADEVDEFFGLYEALLKLFLAETRIIAKGPGRIVKWNENLTISTLGPDRYARLMMPVYQQAVPILASAGKRALVHYDGALKAIADQVAKAPFHIIESLTEPPEGDMMYDECRAAWPDKAFCANINVDLYSLPPEKLREAVIAKRGRAGKKGLAFAISEDVPKNWREVIPVVLDTLEELN